MSINEKTIYEISNSDLRLGENIVRLQQAYRTEKGNPEELAELVRAAMGKRSQRAFAKDLGVNVSTVSRILDGNILNISDAVLAKIAANADSGSGVTIEDLMAAQGIVEARNTNEIAVKNEEACRRIIADELLKRGFSVSYPALKPNYVSRYICDFELVTDALRGSGRWLFEIKLSSGRSMKLPTGVGSTRIWIDSAMAAYYRGETMSRVSLVVDRQIVFSQVKDILAQTKIRDEISVMLISLPKMQVIDEFVAPMIGKKKELFSFGEAR